MTEDLREQYATDDNLRAWIALHAGFSINPHWAEWLFDREAPGAGRPYPRHRLRAGHFLERQP
jgi:hypothetical protein